MGGWQWGSGMALPAYARTTEGGWIPASVFAGAGSPRRDGDGSPHTRGQRVGDGFSPSVFARGGFRGGDGDGSPHTRGQRRGVGSRFRLCGGGFSAEGRGWVPAYARTTEGGMGSRLSSWRGRLTAGGMGMGPRIREDNGRGVGSRFRLCGGGFSVGGWGWVPASARTTGGGGFPHPSLRGRVLRGGMGMGPRIPRTIGGQDLGEDTGAWGRGTGGSRTAPTEGEYCRARGSPPSPVFTRAGSNLPPSRGKGFVGDERAIFIVMTCGECAALRSGGGRGRRRCLGGAIVA